VWEYLAFGIPNDKFGFRCSEPWPVLIGHFSESWPTQTTVVPWSKGPQLRIYHSIQSAKLIDVILEDTPWFPGSWRPKCYVLGLGHFNFNFCSFIFYFLGQNSINVLLGEAYIWDRRLPGANLCKYAMFTISLSNFHFLSNIENLSAAYTKSSHLCQCKQYDFMRMINASWKTLFHIPTMTFDPCHWSSDGLIHVNSRYSSKRWTAVIDFAYDQNTNENTT